jgi:hypothetical protein
MGNKTVNYIAGFHAANKIYCGQRVYQKYCNEWRDKEGDVIIDQGTQVDFRAAEIVFTTGISVTGGGSLHARLGYTGNCTEDMSQRNGNENISGFNSVNLQNNEGKKEDVSMLQNKLNADAIVYPNPIAENNSLNLELINSSQGLTTIFDITGKVILTVKIIEGKNQIPLPQNGKGIYFINIQYNENKIFNKKLVVY